VAILEPDVAILVPAFGRREQTMKAVRAALASSAGEVVVSLDTDPDRLSCDLEAVQDVRLRVVVQPHRLGLWPNHLALLRETRRPFVKFLQTDDWLLPGGLRTLCEAVDEGTSVVSGLPYYQNLETQVAWRLKTPTAPGRWTSADFLRRAEVAGNELGRPSYTLFRRDAVPATEEVWRDDVSVDWAVNLVAAGHGDVVLVPHGTVVCGVHDAQDGATQSPALVARRLVNTLELLSNNFGTRFYRIVSYQAASAVVLLARNAVGLVARGRTPLYRGVSDDVRRLLRLVDWRTLTSRPDLARAVKAVAFRYATEWQPVEIPSTAT
jgi:hypothetical protein